MKIVIASDHRAIEKKDEIIKYLEELQYEVKDLGPSSIIPVDYPEYAFKVTDEICNKTADLGILLCGTGIGMSIAANKVKGIRCAKVSTEEEASLTRLHNDANVIALSSKTDKELTKKIVKTFVETEFSGDERHKRRIGMLEK